MNFNEKLCDFFFTVLNDRPKHVGDHDTIKVNQYNETAFVGV